MASRTHHSKHTVDVMYKDKPMPSTDDTSFTIMSWNILANHFVLDGRAVYTYAGPFAEWTHRMPLQLQTFQKCNADIICLQEVEVSHFDDVLVAFFREMGYQGVMQNNGKRSPTHCTGNATFYRVAKFEMVWEEHRSRALAIGLRVRASHSSAKILALANVHLDALIKHHDRRFSQLKSLTKQLQKPGGVPVIVGDFNHSLDGSIRDFIFDGVLAAGYEQGGVIVTKEESSHPFKFKSVYSTSDKEPTYVCPPDHVYRIDHIVYAWDALEPIAVLEITPELQRDTIALSFLPNVEQPSDHLSVGCLFKWIQ